MHGLHGQAVRDDVAAGGGRLSRLSPRTRNVAGAIIGNTLEWFDILVYA
jgi:MFS family permease